MLQARPAILCSQLTLQASSWCVHLLQRWAVLLSFGVPDRPESQDPLPPCTPPAQQQLTAAEALLQSMQHPAIWQICCYMPVSCWVRCEWPQQASGVTPKQQSSPKAHGTIHVCGRSPGYFVHGILAGVDGLPVNGLNKHQMMCAW